MPDDTEDQLQSTDEDGHTSAAKQRRGTGLLLVMMEIDPEHEDDFNAWYDTEHIPERLAIPGFVSARRFRATEGTPKYLALYELDSPAVLESDEYEHFKNAGQTEWTDLILSRLTGFVRNVYVELLPAEEATPA